jgi:hypothetical protein
VAVLWLLQHESLSACLLECQKIAVAVVHFADVVPEVKLAQVLIKILFADVVIDTVDSTLQDAEVALIVFVVIAIPSSCRTYSLSVWFTWLCLCCFGTDASTVLVSVMMCADSSVAS